METDLMPCPMPNCGKAVRLYRIESDCHRLSCSGCDYFFDLFDADKKPGGLAVLRERHNTLARRAEIGALVERLIPENAEDLTLAKSNDIFDTSVSGVFAHGPTLLAALRSLAAEIGGTER